MTGENFYKYIDRHSGFMIGFYCYVCSTRATTAQQQVPSFCLSGKTPVIGESETFKEVQVCTQLSKLAVNKLK